MTETNRQTDELNLSTHRAQESVWERPDRNDSPEIRAMVRVLVGVGGAALAVQGVRLNTWTGRALAGMGGTLVWWALTGEGDLSKARRWFTDTLEWRPWHHADTVLDASAASFPASDPPSWTPTTGTGLRGGIVPR
jgi:uncharacterized membrane protein